MKLPFWDDSRSNSRDLRAAFARVPQWSLYLLSLLCLSAMQDDIFSLPHPANQFAFAAGDQFAFAAFTDIVFHILIVFFPFLYVLKFLLSYHFVSLTERDSSGWCCLCGCQRENMACSPALRWRLRCAMCNVPSCTLMLSMSSTLVPEHNRRRPYPG